VAVDPRGAPPPNGGAGLPKAEGDSPTIAARQKEARPAAVSTKECEKARLACRTTSVSCDNHSLISENCKNCRKNKVVRGSSVKQFLEHRFRRSLKIQSVFGGLKAAFSVFCESLERLWRFSGNGEREIEFGA